MKYIDEVEIKNKKVLLRCDFNVPIKDGKIVDDSKITKSFKTIDYLLENDNKVIILSHFGRVKTEEDKKNNSLYPVYLKLKEQYKIEFIKDPLELEDINKKDCNLYLVENTRFTDVEEKRESANDLKLAKYWASFGDVFVVDAFASLHRAHSSTAGISTYLDTYLGFLVKQELTNLEPLISDIKRPLVVIMGGAKAQDKIEIITALLEKCDKLILTGGILNTFLSMMGYNVGNSLVCTDEKVLASVKDILEKSANKICYSNKFIVARNDINMEVSLEEIENNDIIYDNLLSLREIEIIKMAETIFFNGTCGKYELEEYSHGTKNLLENLKNTNASVYIGGGDTVGSVHKLASANDYKYLSSGGGATLEYVAYNKLAALEYIKNAKK